VVSVGTMFGSLLPQLFVAGSCFNYVICVCLRIVVSNTYCGGFFGFFSLPVSLGCPFLSAPTVFSKVYLQPRNSISKILIFS
jgi:hypothetical protein